MDHAYAGCLLCGISLFSAFVTLPQWLWFVPYVLGAAGIGFVILVAVVWHFEPSRKWGNQKP